MTRDAVVVGSGPNGLAAAVTLAAHGLEVTVLEAADAPGGGLATEELTLPGYRHDVCSAVHPLGWASPLFRALPLESHGLEWIHPPLPAAHPLDEGPAALLASSVEATASGLGRDGPSYRDLVGPLVERWPRHARTLLGPPGPAPLDFVPWAWHGLRSARSVARGAFVDLRARALWAGLGAHAVIPLERAPSAGVALTLAVAAHAGGWPIPRGGAGRLAEALVALLEGLGGKVRTGERVRSPFEIPPARAILFDLGPAPLLAILAETLPPRARRRLARLRYGPGAFKLDWALSDPIPWRDPDVATAGTVHVGGSWEEIARSEREACAGRAAERPFVLLAQPSRFDETRAPAGRHTAWAYCHVPPGGGGASADEMAERIERQIERFAPGFRDCILARSVLPPSALEARNPNLVGGDVGGGRLTVRRALFGALGPGDPYALPLGGLYVCSAATPPGAGVHGMCGFHAARAALRDRFGIRIPADPAAALQPRLRTHVASRKHTG